MRSRILVPVLALPLLLAACGSGRSAGTLAISGDTLIYHAIFGLPDGQQNANCGYRLTARVEGAPGDTAVLRQGRVTYSFIDTGLEHATWEWTPERLPTLWEQPRVAAGETATSLHHDISFSLPFRAVRAEVVFDYTLGGDDAVRATVPFVFHCL